MQKMTTHVRLVVILVATGLVAAGCMNPVEGLFNTSADGTGNLSIQVGRGVGANTWQPTSEARTPQSYEVLGQGPLGATFEAVIDVSGESVPTDTAAVDIPTLLAGSWQITVNAINEDEDRIATGSATVTVVAGHETGVSITVRPTVGEGTLDVSIDWTAALDAFATESSSISATGTLYQGWGDDRSSVPLDVTEGENSWSVDEELPSGWYVFEFALTDTDVNGNTVDIYTIREAVRIMGDGLVTKADVSIDADDVAKRGEIGLTINMDMEDSIALSFGDNTPTEISRGGSITISAGNLPEGADVEWTINNEVIKDKVGPSLTLDFEDLPLGISTITLLVRYQDRFSSVSVRVETKETPSYEIGDTGPAGGIVFYAASEAFTAEGTECNTECRYLEAWTADEIDPHQWKTSQTSTPGTSTTIGSGYTNTYTAMSGTEHPAAEVARNASHGGFDDWFLPSKDELDLMYEQIVDIGLFASAVYWSSSEVDSNFAWGQFFGNRDQFSGGKTGDSRVRVVRAF